MSDPVDTSTKIILPIKLMGNILRLHGFSLLFLNHLLEGTSPSNLFKSFFAASRLG